MLVIMAAIALFARDNPREGMQNQNLLPQKSLTVGRILLGRSGQHKWEASLYPSSFARIWVSHNAISIRRSEPPAGSRVARTVGVAGSSRRGTVHVKLVQRSISRSTVTAGQNDEAFPAGGRHDLGPSETVDLLANPVIRLPRSCRLYGSLGDRSPLPTRSWFQRCYCRSPLLPCMCLGRPVAELRARRVGRFRVEHDER